MSGRSHTGKCIKHNEPLRDLDLFLFSIAWIFIKCNELHLHFNCKFVSTGSSQAKSVVEKQLTEM